MNIGGILLGLVNVAIVVVLFLLVGALAAWMLGHLGWAPPDQVQKLYLALVALIALYMIVALLFGLPSITVFPLR